MVLLQINTLVLHLTFSGDFDVSQLIRYIIMNHQIIVLQHTKHLRMSVL